MEKEGLKLLVEKNYSIREISSIMEKDFTSIRYWLKKYNLKTNGYKKVNNWNEESLKLAVSKSKCKSDVLRILNISTKSGNFQTLDRYIKKYKINDSGLIYDNKRGNKFIKKYSNDEIFCENSKITRKCLKNRIIKEKLIPYVCKECGIDNNWNGKKLNLQLDHENGINDDCRFENLRFLCPNCHSQTDTYCSKNKVL